MRLNELQTLSEHREESTNLSPLPEVELRFLGRSARGSDSISSELSLRGAFSLIRMACRLNVEEISQVSTQ
jgi:hypothetical protein